jgi:hypothetical protein
MLGWFRARCPVEPAAKQWLEERMLWLAEEYGTDYFRSVQVVLPLDEFFPDPYSGSVRDVRCLLRRVCEYMDVDPKSVRLELYENRDPTVSADGLQRGAAGVYQQDRGKHVVGLDAANLGDPMGLVGTMAHELAHAHLLGDERISPEAEDMEPLTDLLTVFLGMGLFTANSVIREKYWQDGHSAGWQMKRQGYLTMPMYGYAHALFAWARREEQPVWARYLRGDVRDPFQQGLRFLKETGDSAFHPDRL